MAGKKRSASIVDDSDAAEAPAPTAPKKNKSAAAAAHPQGKDDDGNPFWEVRLGQDRGRGVAGS